MSASKFKAGDRVRRTIGSWGSMRVGSEGVVMAVRRDGGLTIEGHNDVFDDTCYALVSSPALPALPEATKDTNPKDAIGDKKVPLWLCSPIAKAKWALAQFAGMCKYGAWNWRIAGVRTSVYLSAMERHMDAYKSGEELDPVDGTEHLANIMACCAILLDAKEAGKLTDDRPPSVGIRGTYTKVQDQMVALREMYKDMAPRHYNIEDTQA